MKIITPIKIKEELDKVVIGQEHAKKALSIALYKHMIRKLQYDNNLEKQLKNMDCKTCSYRRKCDDYDSCRLEEEIRAKIEKQEKHIIKTDTYINKSNVILTGLSGTGKTLLAQTLAKIADVPFAMADATTMTAPGYAGEDVESCLRRLYLNANGKINKAEFGIVFIDEIDKKAKKSVSSDGKGRDVSGESVQEGLLKIIEGTKATFPAGGGKKSPYGQDNVEINTDNIMFIIGGAFNGIEEIVRRRLNEKEEKITMGFGSTIENKSNTIKRNSLRKQVTQEDIIEFGMLPELVGRISSLTNLSELTEKELIKIIKNKNGLLDEYRTLFEIKGKTITFDDDIIRHIAKIALEKEVGARGLRTLLEEIMFDVMFTMPSDSKKHYKINMSNLEYANKIEVMEACE